VEVVIALNLRKPAAVAKYYREYWKLRGLYKLDFIYIKTNGKVWPLWKLYKELIKKRHMSIEQVVNAVEIAIHKLPYMESLYGQAKDQAEKMQHTIQRLANDIEARKNKILFLDKTAFSSDQECKRTEQQVQELIAQKDRLEKFVANILNDNEGYSNLKQVAKDNVKAVLSDNKIQISVSFAAMIQTLKGDPEIVHLIHNIPTANDDYHRDNNNNNITKYFELNKNRLIDLAEKNYENLVEALTNNAINTFAHSSSPNTTLSLPQSSSTIPNSFDQIDTFRKEESEFYDKDDNKWNIAD
jgi:hypothetical protein